MTTKCNQKRSSNDVLPNWFKPVAIDRNVKDYQPMPIANSFKIRYHRELFEENNK